MTYEHRLYEFYYPERKVKQQKVLIPHGLFLKVRELPHDEQNAAFDKLTGNNEWFTDESPLYEAIETGILNCNGIYNCVVKQVVTKEATYELQRVDCNCNDCYYLSRLLDKFNSIVAKDKVLQQEMFDLTKNRKITQVKNDIVNIQKHRTLIKNADDKLDSKAKYLKELQSLKHGYQGQQNPTQYGVCSKFKKEVIFTPNTCQPDTQQCFIHRKDVSTSLNPQ